MKEPTKTFDTAPKPEGFGKVEANEHVSFGWDARNVGETAHGKRRFREIEAYGRSRYLQ
jgi:hypothetical protein